MFRTVSRLFASLRLSLLGACVAAADVCAAQVGSGEAPRNVLVIVADDIGIDMIHQFGSHPASAPTPNIDQLCAEGVSFMNAFTDPICSPTRAGIMTGRYAVRSLIGRPIHEWQNAWSLPIAAVTLPKLIAQHAPTPVAMSAVGKWHLGTANNGGALHPNLSGFPHFSGILGNFSFGTEYTNWTKVVNGVSSTSTTYATTDQVDDAIARIGAMPEPWFLYLGFSAAHIPFHAPPAHLHTYNLSGQPEATPVEHYRAAVQAMDTEIGRLMQSIPPEVRENTMVIFLADNGSVTDAVLPPGIPNQSKGTLFEGGVRVPFVISGAGVAYPGSRCYALVQAVDVFSTTLDALGIDPFVAASPANTIDGLSLLPYLEQPWAGSEREFIYAQRFEPNGPPPYTSAGYMVRDARWKFVDRGGPGNLFFDLASGANAEQVNLLDQPLNAEQAEAIKRLRGYLKRILM
jgi:arylsulfatase A-like enzyme